MKVKERFDRKVKEDTFLMGDMVLKRDAHRDEKGKHWKFDLRGVQLKPKTRTGGDRNHEGEATRKRHMQLFTLEIMSTMHSKQTPTVTKDGGEISFNAQMPLRHSIGL